LDLDVDAWTFVRAMRGAGRRVTLVADRIADNIMASSHVWRVCLASHQVYVFENNAQVGASRGAECPAEYISRQTPLINET
jgi:hypothetical protein